MKARGARSAVTLIELVVVMVIIGIMVSMVAPKLRVTPMTWVRTEARLMMKDAETARNKALSEKKITRFKMVAGTNQYMSYIDDDADGVINESAAEMLAINAFGTRALDNSVVFGRGNAAAGIPGEAGVGAVTFAGSVINFDTRALPSPFGTSGTIYLTSTKDANAVYAIQMSGAGSFRFWSYKSSTNTWQ